MAKKLTDTDIVDYVLECKKESTDTRKDIEDLWNNMQLLYEGKIDTSQKEEWQFKVFPGQVWKTVKGATSLLAKILVNTPNYLAVEGVEFPDDEALAEAMEEALRFYFKRCGFVDVWREAAESSLLYGLGVIKWGIVRKQDFLGRKYSDVSCVFVDPRDYLFPYDNSYAIHHMTKTVPEVKELANAGFYDKSRLNRITNTDYTEDSTNERDDRFSRLGITNVPNSYRPLVCLDEYWGDILDSSGNIALKNMRVIVANEKYVLSKTPNPYESGKRPFATITPLRVINRHIGAGIFDGVEQHQLAMTKLTNLLLDACLFRIMPMFEGDIQIADDPDDLYSWEPGKVIPKKGQGQVLAPVITQDIPSGGLNMLTMLRQDIQNHTGVTDRVMGTPNMKGSPTATQVAEETAASQSFFEQMSKDIEQQGIVGSAEIVADFVIQMASTGLIYGSISRIFKAKGIVIEQVAADYASRAEIYNSWDIVPRGISMFFEKREALQGLQQIGEMLLKAPIPEVQDRIKYGPFISRLVDAMRISNPDEFIRTDEEYEAERQKKEAIAQEQAMQQQQMAMMAKGGNGQAPNEPSIQAEGQPQDIKSLLAALPPELVQGMMQGGGGNPQ